MNTEFIQIRENQKNSWNNFSGGWKKWDDFTMKFLQGQCDAIIRGLEFKSTDHVLDIASGTGEPGLTIASQYVKNGKVIATDLSEKMLDIAMEKARARSLSNFEVQVADACDLPFEDASFDAVSCRLGFMFFPDMEQAAREMMRVLKPGGKLIATVWAEPAKNPWVTTIMGAIKKHVELPTPDPKAPGIFRCAAPGFLPTLFEGMAVYGGEEREISGKMDCSSVDEYLEFMGDVVPPVVNAFNQVDLQVREMIRQDLNEALSGNLNEGIAWAARVFTVVK